MSEPARTWSYRLFFPAAAVYAAAIVPLSVQDPRLWSRERIIEAEGLLTDAARLRRFGRFQCEAAHHAFELDMIHVDPRITHTRAAMLRLQTAR